jgi:NAD(P)-dependent dehydrogenase (short-subunit alcohol dehydrogenase family)
MPAPGPLEGKVALVAGACRGAGRGTAVALGEAGATVLRPRDRHAPEYGFTDVDGSQPDCWRYIVEVQEAGLPADPTGYR